MYDFNRLYEPASVEEAVQMLQAHPEAKVIAGGSDLLIQMRDGVHAGVDLVSIYLLDELRGVTMEPDGTIVIGALTSFTHINQNPIVQEHLGVLAEAVGMVGGPQVRNIGTIGGNVCNGHTGADSGSTLVALDAIVELVGPAGKRQISIREFYHPDGKLDLQPAEILTAFRFPKSCYEGYQGAYIKYAMRNAMDVDIVGCSTNVKLSADKKTVEDVRIAYGVLGPIPVRMTACEDAMRGQPVCKDTLMRFADEAVKQISPRTDMRATKDFRVHMAHVMAKRTFGDAIAACGGSSES